MEKLQACRMELHRAGLELGRRIKIVANHRPTKMGEMHADLVSTAAFQPASHQKPAVDALELLDVGSRRLATGHDRPEQGVARVTGQRRINGEPGIGEVAMDHGDVTALDFSPLNHCGQFGMGLVAFGDDEQSGCFLVEPVDDSRTPLPGECTEGMRPRQQAMDQGGSGQRVCRVDGQPPRLVNNKQVLIFKRNLEFHGNWDERVRSGVGNGVGRDGHPWFQLRPGFGGNDPIHGDEPGLDMGRYLGPARLGELAAQEPVQPLLLGRNPFHAPMLPECEHLSRISVLNPYE